MRSLGGEAPPRRQWDVSEAISLSVTLKQKAAPFRFFNRSRLDVRTFLCHLPCLGLARDAEPIVGSGSGVARLLPSRPSTLALQAS